VHILRSRTAQISLELHFCMELHTKKPCYDALAKGRNLYRVVHKNMPLTLSSHSVLIVIADNDYYSCTWLRAMLSVRLISCARGTSRRGRSGVLLCASLHGLVPIDVKSTDRQLRRPSEFSAHDSFV